jgi:hypothetical protein
MAQYLIEYSTMTVTSGATAASATYMGKWNKLGIMKPATGGSIAFGLAGANEATDTQVNIYTTNSGTSTLWSTTALSAAGAYIYEGPVWPYMSIVQATAASADTTYTITKFKEHF